MRESHVVVVGAGMAGLVSALLLSHQGVRVTVVEAAPAPGGKVRQLHVDGLGIDSGPTVFTMRWVFDELFDQVNASFDNELTVHPLSVLARHAWHDGSALDLFADVQASTDAIARFAGTAQAKNFVRFCDKARSVYNTLQGPYIQTAAPGVLQITKALGPRGLAVLASLGAMSSSCLTYASSFSVRFIRRVSAGLSLTGRWVLWNGALRLALGVWGTASNSSATCSLIFTGTQSVQWMPLFGICRLPLALIHWLYALGVGFGTSGLFCAASMSSFTLSSTRRYCVKACAFSCCPCLAAYFSPCLTLLYS